MPGLPHDKSSARHVGPLAPVRRRTSGLTGTPRRPLVGRLADAGTFRRTASAAFGLTGQRNSHVPSREMIDGRPGVRVHAYPFADVLRPRGGALRTESLSLTIAEALWNAYRLWMDPAYRDSRAPLHVAGQIGANLVQEVSAALDDLHRRIRADLTT